MARQGFQYAFLGNAVLVALFAGFAWRVFREGERASSGRGGVAESAAAAEPAPEMPAAHAVTGSTRAPGSAARPWRDPRLLLLAVGFLLATAAYSQWTTTVATHLQVLGYSLPQYSVLWTINGAVILLGQPLVSRLARRVPDVLHQILVGTAVYVLVFLALITNRAYAGFVVLMVLLTFGEMLVWPGVPAAADRIAPEGSRGAYQGIISGATSAGRMTGPLAGGLIYDSVSPAAVFIVMSGVLVAAWVLFTAAGRSVRRS